MEKPAESKCRIRCYLKSTGVKYRGRDWNVGFLNQSETANINYYRLTGAPFLFDITVWCRKNWPEKGILREIQKANWNQRVY